MNTFLVNIELIPRIEESVELITAAETAPRPGVEDNWVSKEI